MGRGMRGARTAPGVVPVAELFYSFQGEGPSLGRRSLFVRTMGCNLSCGYPAQPRSASTTIVGLMACDTGYTWNRVAHDLSDGVRHLTAPQIWDELMRLDPATRCPALPQVRLIVATGGEPLLHKDALLYLAGRASATGREMEIETNATLRPGPELIGAGVAFNAGIKLASSAVPRKLRIRDDVIAEIQASGRARWKFVVCAPDDLAEIEELQRDFGLTDIWLSPEGTTPAAVIEHMRLVADTALARGWNLTTREHVLIWDGQRGR